MRSSSRNSARSQAARGGICVAAHAFERLAIRPRKRHGGIARDARGEPMALEERQLREAPLDALVRVAQPLLEPQHFFTDDREAKVPRLDDAGVHRAHRDLVHALALRRARIRKCRWPAACHLRSQSSRSGKDCVGHAACRNHGRRSSPEERAPIKSNAARSIRAAAGNSGARLG